MLDFLIGFVASRDLFADFLLVEPGCHFALQCCTVTEPCETGKHWHSREVGFMLPQTPVVEDGQKRKFAGRNLPNQDHVFVFWLVLAQGVSGLWLPTPQAALLPAAGTEGAQFASIAGSCTRPSGLSLPALAITASQGGIYF